MTLPKDGPTVGATPDGEATSGPVVRDRRRLDPETGQVRTGAGTDTATGADGDLGVTNGAEQRASSADNAGADTAGVDTAGVAPAAAPSVADSSTQLEAARTLAEERLADLQRLQAEYVNYRRRVERDRDVARENAVAGVLEALLPVLDDVHLARQHGDLESGPFAAIADKLESVLARFGLARFGEPGETFDPTVHEALMHTQAELAEGTTETTVVQVLQPGYRQSTGSGDKVLRAARVAVADPR
jgi:molecular chaperone GrpE